MGDCSAAAMAQSIRLMGEWRTLRDGSNCELRALELRRCCPDLDLGNREPLLRPWRVPWTLRMSSCERHGWASVCNETVERAAVAGQKRLSMARDAVLAPVRGSGQDRLGKEPQQALLAATQKSIYLDNYHYLDRHFAPPTVGAAVRSDPPAFPNWVVPKPSREPDAIRFAEPGERSPAHARRLPQRACPGPITSRSTAACSKASTWRGAR